MRMNVTTLGAGAGVAIVFLLIGLLAHQCPADGNPVGFHFDGYVKLEQPAPNLDSCSSATPCYLKIDMAFDPATAPSATPTPCAASSCFAFSNVPDDSLQATTVGIDYVGASRSYTDYAVGVVQGSPNGPSKSGPSPHPSTAR
jgi:hypothetical protein